MKRHALTTLLILLAAALLVLPQGGADPSEAAKPADWPGYRGPNRDGISSETGILSSWPEAGPEKLWQVPLGGGFSGLSIVDGRIFTLYSKGDKEIAAALDAATGKEIWAVALDTERKDRFGDGPRATPLVDGGVVYAVSAFGKLAALKAEDGSEIWSHALQRELGATVPTWGVSATPIVEGDLLLFNVGGGNGAAIAAFDKQSGEVRWKVDSGLPGYSTPITFTAGGVRQTVFFTGTKIVAVSPADGRTLWSEPWKTAYDINAATPIFIAPDRLFVSSGYDTGAAMFKITAAEKGVKAEELWRSRGMKNQFSSSVYHDGYIYGFDNKVLKCIDAATGEDVWRKSGLGHGSLFYADGHLVVLSEAGKLLLAVADPQAFDQQATYQVAPGKHWTVPTLYGGKLFVRNETDLYCFKLSA